MNFYTIKRKKSTLILSFIIIAIVLYCIVNFIRNTLNARNQMGIPVILATVQQKNMPVTVTTIGNVTAYQSVAIKSQVDGIIQSISFTDGQFVKEGDLLFTIDPRPYEAQLQQAQANLTRDQVQLANAKKDYERYSTLSKKGYVSKENYDQQQANSNALEATVKADEAAVAAAQLKLNYCTIRAPINGRTGAKLLDRGNLVRSTDSAPLVIINQLNPIYVTFSLPEKYLPELNHLMQKSVVHVVATANDTKVKELGVLDLINNAIDTTTGSIQLRANYTNDDHQLWPGQFVNLHVDLETLPNALVIPSQAINRGQDGTYVYVVNSNDTAEYRVITIGVANEDETVVTNGLKINERIVVDGQFRLTNGVMVSARN